MSSTSDSGQRVLSSIECHASVARAVLCPQYNAEIWHSLPLMELVESCQSLLLIAVLICICVLAKFQSSVDSLGFLVGRRVLVDLSMKEFLQRPLTSQEWGIGG